MVVVAGAEGLLHLAVVVVVIVVAVFFLHNIRYHNVRSNSSSPSSVLRPLLPPFFCAGRWYGRLCMAISSAAALSTIPCFAGVKRVSGKAIYQIYVCASGTYLAEL